MKIDMTKLIEMFFSLEKENMSGINSRTSGDVLMEITHTHTNNIELNAPGNVAIHFTCIHDITLTH